MVRKLFCAIAVLASITFTEVISGNNGVLITTCNAASYDQNSDGYIYKGTIILTRVVSGQRETFYHLNKRGVDYVAKTKKGPYYRLARRMTINHIDYKY